QAGWEVSRAQPGRDGILVNYSGGSGTDAMVTRVPFATIEGHAGVRADARNGLADLEQVFPGVTGLWNGKATQSLPHQSPFFKASYAYFRRGQYTSFAGYEGVPMGNIFFCGEHTSQDFQGFMEGGASTGQATGQGIRDAIRGRHRSAG